MEDGQTAGYRPDLRAYQQDVRALERRLLTLQQHLTTDGLTDLMFLEGVDIIVEIQHVYQRLQDERERRDLSFLAERRLEHLQRWCRWLIRKVAEECFLRVRLELERQLRAELATETHQLYLHIGEISDIAQEIAGLPDEVLADRLSEGEMAPLLISQLHELPGLHRTGYRNHRPSPA